MEYVFAYFQDQKCLKHEKQISSIIIPNNEQKNLQQCLICKQCEQEISTDEIKIAFEEYKNGFLKNQQDYIYITIKTINKNLESYESFMNELKSEWQKQINSLNSNLTILKQKVYQYTFNIQINQLKSETYLQQSRMLSNDIGKYVSEFTTNLKKGLDSLKQFQPLNKCEQLIQKLSEEFNINKQAQVQEQKQGQISSQSKQLQQGFNFLNALNEQSETCFSISFNYNNTFMISGCDKFIKYWNFNAGKLNLIQKVGAHSEIVSNLLFSKFQNNFISGSLDGHLICWKYLQDNQLQKSGAYEYHQSGISSMIMNQEENLLFTADTKGYIMIWNADLENKELIQLQQLDKHSNQVNGLSLNDAESILVSCSTDRQIIIWQKQLDEWTFIRNVNTYSYEFGSRIKFISNHRFIWVSGMKNGLDILFDFTINFYHDDNLLENKKQLLENQELQDTPLFPIFYDQQKKFIVVKHKINIYLIKQLDNGKLDIIQLKSLKTQEAFGGVTNNGQYLVLWEKKTQKYEVYQIKI